MRAGCAHFTQLARTLADREMLVDWSELFVRCAGYLSAIQCVACIFCSTGASTLPSKGLIMKTRGILLLVAGAIVGSSLAQASLSNALSARYHASSCVTSSHDDISYVEHGILNFSANPVFLTCPINDDDRFGKQNISTLNIHVEQFSSEQFSAYVCSSSWSGMSASCGATAYPTATLPSSTSKTITPSLTFWSSVYQNDFASIKIRIPAKSGSVSNRVKGYFTSSS